ncbi:MAG: A/G-specific adenine glycosylase [bacterium]|nr:A/G-specific adenine glycosylase [bacterium]
MTVASFRRLVWTHYKKFGRHDLPWRKTHDAYKILVSEVMLQQTQVERVVPFYKKFIKKFPTAKKLAAAPLSAVLKSWQGLGYNRRAKMLHQAAKELSMERSDLPMPIAELEKLSGVGSYTARAVAAFAYNQNVVFVETNIRTAVIEHFFNFTKQRKGMIYHTSTKKVSDKEVEEILKKALPKGKAREWYSALMDYGAYLKRSGISHNAKSKTNTRQSKFTGSIREARGAIMREFTNGVRSRIRLINLLGPSRRVQMNIALKALIAEGLINENLLSTVSFRHPPKR